MISKRAAKRPEDRRVEDLWTDAEFMTRQAAWPIWPYLPLKRGSGSKMESGFLWGTLEGLPKWRVYLGICFDEKTFEKPMKFKDYRSADAVAVDGWRVD